MCRSRSTIRSTLKKLEGVSNGTRPKFEISGPRPKPAGGVSVPRNRRGRIPSSPRPSSSDTPNDLNQLSGLPAISGGLHDLPLYPYDPSPPSHKPTPTSYPSTLATAPNTPIQLFASHGTDPLSSHLISTLSSPQTQAPAPGGFSEVDFSQLIDPQLR